MKQIARCEFGGGLSEISLNKLIIKLIKRNIRIPSESLGKGKFITSFPLLVPLGSVVLAFLTPQVGYPLKKLSKNILFSARLVVTLPPYYIE